VAEDYERYRPGYPVEVVDRVLDYAADPVRTAVEIGAGTGKATRRFATRGMAITAVEPDVGMLEVLRRETAGLDVEPVQSTFETFDAEARFDLLYSAAAWHWTDPTTRWGRTATLVRPGGAVAFFGSPTRVVDPDLENAVASARRTFVPDDDVHPGGRREARGELRWPGTELEDCALFTDVVQQRIPREGIVSRHDFLHQLATVSAYLLLTPEARADVLGRIGAVLPDEVRVDRTVTLHLARTKETK
jgi:SAM-dependent methyltransferase